MSMDVMAKANELAEALSNSTELVNMRMAEIAMRNDLDAAAILEEFQKKQKEIFDMQRMGLELSEIQKQAVTTLENRMSGNDKIKAFMEASHKFEVMLQSVNMTISRALSGDEGCGCGSDCGDCGGGCGGGCS